MFKNGARYRGIGPYLTERFGGRTVKASIDAGFTCPNRDGTRGTGGCIFCSADGSGEYAGIIQESRESDGGIRTPQKQSHDTELASPVSQISSQLSFLSSKWSNPLCIAYFQNFTNTYAPVSVLRPLYENALEHPRCVGLAVATRPDCIDDQVLALFDEINQKTFLWVELGLQTASDQTADRINRCCSLQEYDDCVRRLHSHHIRVVTHVMFGLPGESSLDMMHTVRHVCREPIFGIKIHMLNILKGTRIEAMYRNNLFRLPERDEYISLVCDALEIIPEPVTIHRLTGDAPSELLIAPDWIPDKRYILNHINQELKRRGSIQGCRVD